MYVCVCNAITERQVRASVAAGASTLSDLQFDLGVATCCGCCADTARQYLPEGGCERAFEAEVTVFEAEAAVVAHAVEAAPAPATTRRFPVHRIARAA
ncbi:hypothetical protein GCM10023144_23380 [Pigmentiphaga soli]|uniref:Bacterioferritin-associated ferredoxin n=1 Tax=Pigmentiphaga soli TaxID=1007095 RepID=A0ABP8H150_9BURK